MIDIELYRARIGCFIPSSRHVFSIKGMQMSKRMASVLLLLIAVSNLNKNFKLVILICTILIKTDNKYKFKFNYIGHHIYLSGTINTHVSRGH